MSASGKSSNRHSEYNRGRSTGTGHGIYAAAGIHDRAAAAAQDPPDEHVLSIPADWKAPLPRLAPPERDPLAVALEQHLSTHRHSTVAGHADHLAQVARDHLAQEGHRP